MKQLLIICLLLLYGCSSQQTIQNTQTTISSTTQSMITPTYGEIYAHMLCERISLDQDIYYGDDEILIMYTCYPFDALETDERFFVYARLIKKY